MAQPQPRSSPAPRQPRPPRLAWTTTTLVAALPALAPLRAVERRGRGQGPRCTAEAPHSGAVPRCKSPRQACEEADTRKSAPCAQRRTRISHLRTETQARHLRMHTLRCSSCDSIAA